MKNASMTIEMDLRSSKQDGSYPIKLRIFYNRDFKRYGLGISATKEEWEFLQQARPKGKKPKSLDKVEKVRQKIDLYRNKAQAILDSLKEFSYEEFEKGWFNKQESKEDVYSLFEAHIKLLKEEKRISTASSYNVTLVSLRKFKKNLHIHQLTADFLKKYERWLLDQGNSLTTAGIYARNIRTIVNKAMALGLLKKEAYPFGSRNGAYSIPQGHNIKRALSESDLRRILDYQVEDPNSTEARSLDFFILSYLCNGANFKDICRWKFKNIIDNQIIFLRAKTELTTRKSPIQIKVFISDRIRNIIEKWQNKNKFSENYIFPILQKGITAEQERAIAQQFVKTTNKYIKRIAQKLEIEGDITTYTARHTFATRLKRKGASTEFIKESLGHQNILTTENYLDSFEDKERVKWANALLE